jgi:DNA-binding XRE family transcriptional regulator
MAHLCAPRHLLRSPFWCDLPSGLRLRPCTCKCTLVQPRPLDNPHQDLDAPRRLTDSAPECMVAHMATPIPKIWQRGRAELDLTSVQAAALLRISGGALRAIECGSNKAVSLRLAYRASRLYRIPVDDLLIAEDDDLGGPPRRPKSQPKTPAPRKKGSKRAASGASAA